MIITLAFYFQDMHCSHLFKVGAKLQACQESVSDPSDLVHALKVCFTLFYLFQLSTTLRP